ncbi:MAG: RNA polymerase sigma-54 factor [Bacteroidaceae bacterium]|nr:RNA polymerase sigma-54 factor [Bacteroidaceae bacterium]
MAQKLGHTQVQTQQQTLAQVLSPQQLLQVKVLELSINELEERVRLELDENPALTQDFSGNESDGMMTDNDESLESVEREQNDLGSREERQDALDDALRSIAQDDDFDFSPQQNDNEPQVFSFGETSSFYDELTNQIYEHDLTDKQTEIMNYLIGTLDDDGYLRSNVDAICEELAIYHGIDADADEIEEVIKILQHFDPAGIGARDLQECLLLQIEHIAADDDNGLWQTDEGQRMISLMKEVIKNHFRNFTLKHWQDIQKDLQISSSEAEMLFSALTRLNPKPGQAMGEAMNKSTEQITPDFIAETYDNGTVSFSLNNGNMPELIVEPSFEKLSEDDSSQQSTVNSQPTPNREQSSKLELPRCERSEGRSRDAERESKGCEAQGGRPKGQQSKEAQMYARTKVSEARGFITALQVRRQTMYRTMKAIIEKQHAFFEDGDEMSLKPMILKDIADKTGLDISTISRVCNSKYVQTRWGVFPLKFFFTDGYKNKDGEEVSVVAIKQVLKEIIELEKGKKPFPDDVLAKKMKERGYPIARRTVAKYREQMGIPVARLRR